MVGTDTPSPERWYYVVEHANFSRNWLAELPADVADNIAFRNAERLGRLGAGPVGGAMSACVSPALLVAVRWASHAGGRRRALGLPRRRRAGLPAASPRRMPRSPIAGSRRELKVGQFFAVEVIACRAPGAEPVRDIVIDAHHAGARPRHELPAGGCARQARAATASRG